MDEKRIVGNFLKISGVPDGVSLTDSEFRLIADNLTHKEERTSSQRDQWGNWEHDFTSQDYSRPYLDHYIDELLEDRNASRKSKWPDGKDFAFCLTHDLDSISENDPVQLNRRYAKRIRASASAVDSMKMLPYYFYTGLRSFISKKEDDPLWHFEKWCDTERKYGFTSTWFIYIAEDDLHYYDNDLLPSDIMKFRGEKMTYAEFIKKLSLEGFEIGLHGSYLSFDNDTIFAKQKKSLEQLTGKQIKCTRQHFLHYEFEKTSSVHQTAGINIDSTLGFNTVTGYRAGTSIPYFIGDTLLEVPQLIMDGALFNANSHAFDEREACDRIVKIINQVEKVNGCLTINFHPNYLNRPLWWNTYLFLLEELSNRNALCVTMEGIYNHVKKVCAE